MPVKAGIQDLTAENAEEARRTRSHPRHCEERSDEAIQSLDRFASLGYRCRLDG